MTCLCITKNRREWLPKAIQCFLDQTYPNRGLLIVSDGDDVRDLVPVDERIQHIHIAEGANIGEKRNFGSSRATGELIASWDDDDYSAPGRLVDQVDRVLVSGKAVTGYHTMRFRSEWTGEWWLYTGKANYAMGTSLLYRRRWGERHPFPCRQIGEDQDFATEAAAHGELESVDAGEFMWASMHDGNTSPRLTGRSGWSRYDESQKQTAGA